MTLPQFRNGIRVVRYWRGYRVDIGRPGNGFDVPEAAWSDDAALGAIASSRGLTLEQVRAWDER